MKNLTDFLKQYETGRKYVGLWGTCLSAMLGLGAIRFYTNAEYAFASALIIPVVTLAWVGGRLHGLIAALVAATIWLLADLTADFEHRTAWIPWMNALTRFMTFALVVALASSLKKALQKETENAEHDQLTGLINRRRFIADGQQETDRAIRYSRPISLMFIDLDNFKQLNDSQGHDAGDDALRNTAQALQKALRSSDYASRLGGDEFAVLLPETDYLAAVDAGNKVLAALQTSLASFPQVSVSIGIATYDRADNDFLVMLKAADAVMYEVKRAGKGAVKVTRFVHADGSPMRPD